MKLIYHNNRPPHIIAQKGSKDVISMTSVERGENVTVIACMNAAGHFIPPFVIFKRVRKRDDFMIKHAFWNRNFYDRERMGY